MYQVSNDMIGLLREFEIGQRAVAQKYWHLVLFSASPHELQSAYVSLKGEAPAVVDAVLEALAITWNRDVAPLPEENPFC